MDELITYLNAFGETGIPMAALIGFGIWSIMSGKIIPKASVEGRIKDKDDEIERLRTDRDERYDDLIEERNDWREAYRTASATVVELEKQNSELIEVARVSKHVLESLPRPDIGNAHAQVTVPVEAGEDDTTQV